MEFLDVPDTYYDALRKKLKMEDIHIKEDIDTLQVL